MVSRLEYKVIYEINQLVMERDINQNSNNPLLKDYEGCNIKIRLQDRFRKISSNKFERTILSLCNKSYIANENIYSFEC